MDCGAERPVPGGGYICCVLLITLSGKIRNADILCTAETASTVWLFKDDAGRRQYIYSPGFNVSGHIVQPPPPGHIQAFPGCAPALIGSSSGRFRGLGAVLLIYADTNPSGYRTNLQIPQPCRILPPSGLHKNVRPPGSWPGNRARNHPIAGTKIPAHRTGRR